MAGNILEGLSANNIFDLRGVVAVVTGGSSGIGLAISLTLIANGATVYIIDINQARLEKVTKLYNEPVEKIPGRGVMYGVPGDISKKAEARRLAEEIGKREKYVTVLFNNAGIIAGSFKTPASPTAAAYVTSLFDEIAQEDFDNVLNTNAVGPYWLTFAFLPLLENWKKSSEPATKKFVPQIIMTSSMNGWTKDSTTSARSYPYMFSKSALGHATSSLAHELLPLGIRVNGIAPGVFPTEMALPGQTNDSGMADVPEGTDWGGVIIPTVTTGGTQRDMGTLALFLVANWFVNGETVLIDGGTLLEHPSSY